jgi:hypothetical protein
MVPEKGKIQIIKPVKTKVLQENQNLVKIILQ